ncbi:hypothetical protein OC834_000779 [Tilletia horrida]|nr:hypothetical protein OC834_000779 [Tilletia horrida]
MINADNSADNSARWEAVRDTAHQLGTSPSPGSGMKPTSASSTPINTPRSILRQLPAPPPNQPLPPLPAHPPAPKAHFARPLNQGSKAPKSDARAPLMSRSLSQGSTHTMDARQKEVTILPRRNSLYIATPPIRMASLENLHGMVAPDPDQSNVMEELEDHASAPLEGSLGLSMGAAPPLRSTASQESRPQPTAGPSRPVLLGSWLDDDLSRDRPRQPKFSGTLGWADEDDSEDSDSQRFMPMPVRRARATHGRSNSMDSSILSLHESEVESLIDVYRHQPPTPPAAALRNALGMDTASTLAPERSRSSSLTPEHTPTSSPPIQPLLLPSESIIRPHRRPSSSHGIAQRPYAGLQARCQAKIIASSGVPSPDEPVLFRDARAGIPNGADLHGLLGPRHPLTVMNGSARLDADNQSISSIAFSYAPTPPITPLRPTAAGRSSTSESPENTSAMTARQAVFGRMGEGFTAANATTPKGVHRFETANGMVRSSSASDMPVPGQEQLPAQHAAHDASSTGSLRASSSGRVMPSSAEHEEAANSIGALRRPSGSLAPASSVKMGKLRTTIFDSFGIKRTARPGAGEDVASGWGERPTSPIDSVGSHSHSTTQHSQHHLGVDGPGGVLGSLMRRTSLTSQNGGGASMHSGPSSSASSLSKARSHHMGIASLSPASSPLKRTMKLPSESGSVASEPTTSSSAFSSSSASAVAMSISPSSSSAAAAAAKRERIPSSDSQLSTYGPGPSSSREHGTTSNGHHSGASKLSLKSGPSSSSVNSQPSVYSSPLLDRPSKRSHGHGTTTMMSATSTDTHTSSSSIRTSSSRGGGGSGGKSSSGKKGGVGSSAASARSARPVRKEEVARVNAVLAELQGAAFMAPPRTKKTGTSSKTSSYRSR